MVTAPSGRARDADNTRRLLLHAARRRFAREGYAAARVRDIAADAGVSIALINRYFASKEGLFEACLSRSVQEFSGDGEVTLDLVLEGVMERIAGDPDGDPQLRLLMLIRSSGDEGADRIRRNILEFLAATMAKAAGREPDERDLLRAQVAMAAALGVLLLRSSTGIEPMTSASAAELRESVGDLFRALLRTGDSEPAEAGRGPAKQGRNESFS